MSQGLPTIFHFRQPHERESAVKTLWEAFCGVVHPTPDPSELLLWKRWYLRLLDQPVDPRVVKIPDMDAQEAQRYHHIAPKTYREAIEAGFGRYIGPFDHASRAFWSAEGLRLYENTQYLFDLPLQKEARGQDYNIGNRQGDDLKVEWFGNSRFASEVMTLGDLVSLSEEDLQAVLQGADDPEELLRLIKESLAYLGLHLGVNLSDIQRFENRPSDDLRHFLDSYPEVRELMGLRKKPQLEALEASQDELAMELLPEPKQLACGTDGKSVIYVYPGAVIGFRTSRDAGYFKEMAERQLKEGPDTTIVHIALLGPGKEGSHRVYLSDEALKVLSEKIAFLDELHAHASALKQSEHAVPTR